MADPVGLADLGLRGVKKVLKHGSNVRERHRDIEALAVALDQAHHALMSAKTSHYVYQVHEDIIAPLIQETVLFLDAVSARKRFKSLAAKYVQPGNDSLVARRLLKAFKAAPEQIQARALERQLLLSQTQIQNIPQVLNDMVDKQRTAMSHLTRLIMLCNCFFRNGSE